MYHGFAAPLPRSRPRPSPPASPQGAGKDPRADRRANVAEVLLVDEGDSTIDRGDAGDERRGGGARSPRRSLRAQAPPRCTAGACALCFGEQHRPPHARGDHRAPARCARAASRGMMGGRDLPGSLARSRLGRGAEKRQRPGVPTQRYSRRLAAQNVEIRCSQDRSREPSSRRRGAAERGFTARAGRVNFTPGARPFPRRP